MQTSLGSTESLLHTERRSVTEMRAQLRRAKPQHDAEAAGVDVEACMLRDQLEAMTAERDQLVHEVAMVRETTRHNRLKSAEAARSSRTSDVPPESIAGQFHAHTERIRELQTELEVRRVSTCIAAAVTMPDSVIHRLTSPSRSIGATCVCC